MEADFWHRKWQDNQIGFHEATANRLLTQNFAKLSLAEGSRVFLPLCGKTNDIAWLLSQDHKVVGAELSQIAIEQLFDALGVEPKMVNIGNLIHYSHENIDIFVGDIFELTAKIIGNINAVYDRAALVALPAQTRIQYSQHLVAITDNAPQLLICYEYDQNLRAGPPFSVSTEEVKNLYAQSYKINLLENSSANGGFTAIENVWHMAKV